MKHRLFLIPVALVAIQTMALTPARKPRVKLHKTADITAKVSRTIDTEEPAYKINGNDSTCQIFVYSPDPAKGLHLAYLTADKRWVDVGQLCSSD